MKTTAPPPMKVGIRELRNQLSKVLRSVREGQVVTVTDRDRPVAVISRAAEHAMEDRIQAAIAAGWISWSGERHDVPHHRPRVKGATVAAAVIEDRR